MRADLRRKASLLGAWFRARWDGRASRWPVRLFRVGIALLILVRTSDWHGALGPLEHRRWVSGLEYAPSVEGVQAPALQSPLFSFLPQLPDAVLELAAYARPVLALVLLIGVWPRATALVLASLGYGLMALDRYRYFHHLHLLWLSCGLLALCPSSRHSSPRWPVQLLRFQALIVYAAAGCAKLDSDWLSGRTLAALERLDLIGGSLWLQARAALGESALAITVACVELALVGLLAWPRTRLAGIALGLALHAALARAMLLSTFSLQMCLYLLLFLPWPEQSFRSECPRAFWDDDDLATPGGRRGKREPRT